MKQSELFVVPPTSEARRLAEEGIDRAASRKGDLLDLARRIAVRIALSRSDRTCDADCVVEELVRLGHGAHDLGRACSAIFRTREWQFTGERIRSQRVWARGNELKVWRFIGSLAQVPTAHSLPKPEPSGEMSTCPRCRRSTASVLVPINGGRSRREDCQVCNATKGFPKSMWNPPKELC